MILLCPIFYAVKLPDTVHGAKHFSLGEAYKSFQVVTALALTAFIPSPLLHLPPFITILLWLFIATMEQRLFFHFFPLFLLTSLHHLLPHCTSFDSYFISIIHFEWLLNKPRACTGVLTSFSWTAPPRWKLAAEALNVGLKWT